MNNRIGGSWNLVKASFLILKADKKLVIYTIISSVSLILVSLAFIIPIFFSGRLISAVGGGVGIILYLVLFYAIVYSVNIFFNAALVSAVLIRLNGGDPTLSDGLRAAESHLSKLLGYALFSATVGVILRAIAERSNGLRRLVVSTFGLAWNLATFLVLPVLVVEDLEPMDAIKRSSQLLRGTWGEQIEGRFGISLVFSVISTGVILVGVLLDIIAVSVGADYLIIPIVLVCILILIGLGYLSSSLSGIYSAAVYQHTIGKSTEKFFPEEIVAGAFQPRSQSSSVEII
jgi:hypothetical protein